MNSTIEYTVSNIVRRVSGAVLVAMMVCNPAVSMAAKDTEGSGESPFTLDYMCIANTTDLGLAGVGIPADKVFEVKYVSGSLMRPSAGDIGNPAVAVWDYDSQSLPLIIATQPTSSTHMAQVNQSLSVTFYSAPAEIPAMGMPEDFGFSYWCHVRFHGVLKNL